MPWATSSLLKVDPAAASTPSSSSRPGAGGSAFGLPGSVSRGSAIESLCDTILPARIELTVEPDALSWTAVAGAVTYDVVRGDLEVLNDTGGDFSLATEACIADNLAVQTLDVGDPPAGMAYWYLVRGVATTGPMTYQALYDSQVGLRDPEIAAAPSTCP